MMWFFKVDFVIEKSMDSSTYYMKSTTINERR
nr:MAG TPA_asm: hypothetical protein [Bacteriophage sp.]